MIKKLLSCFKCMGRRRRWVCAFLLTWAALVVVSARWLERVGSALLPPPPPDQNLNHFRRTRDLQHYLDHIELLIEPASVCAGPTGVLALVSSGPAHGDQRQAIRDTWGRHMPTYFVLGLPGENIDEYLADTYIEAKGHSDLLVYDIPDHYQNLTLKTMLMLQWTVQRCPHAEFLFKTDDDVLVNPWTLQAVLKQYRQNGKGHSIGYRIQGARIHRDEYTKWFVPRWLHPEDEVSEYLSGTGYLLRGKELEVTLETAKKVPLINLEDVYLTYLVIKRSLGSELDNDRRLSPYRPWLPWDCAYWSLASMHSFKPNEIVHAWAKIERVQKKIEEDSETCRFYRNYFDSDIFLY